MSELVADLARALPVQGGAHFEAREGARLGRFELGRELGRGGFGVVYEAHDLELARSVALKLVRPGVRLMARGKEWALREAQAVARLNHPAIVTLHDLGQGPAGPYLVFERLQGATLAELLEAGPLPLGEVLGVGLEVARALVHAHAAGVVHRDLTAANVHLGEDGTVKVLDFGLAHLFGHEAGGSGGTPAYMAPEQWRPEAGDARSDLFALGVILHQALAGKLPYQAGPGFSEAQRPGRTPQLPRGAAPWGLRRLIRSLLERDPERRPRRAAEVLDRLAVLRGSLEGRRSRRVAWAAGVVSAAVLSGLAWHLLGPEPPAAEQVGILVAAMDGNAGGPWSELAPGQLAAALHRSPRIWVVPRDRLAVLSRQAGLGEPGRLDDERGRMLARLAGAQVLLLPLAVREPAGLLVGVRAVLSETGQPLFLVRARPTAGGIGAAMAELAEGVERGLEERAFDGRLRRPLAAAVTVSPEAARLYYQGEDCEARPVAARGNLEQCRRHYERALALDPTFPLAHYRLAALAFLPGSTGEGTEAHLRAALEAAPRLPAREAGLVKALAARIGGRQGEAARIYEELLSQAPEDPELLDAASDGSAEAADWAALARYSERLSAVRPDDEAPVRWLIGALGRAGRRDRLLVLATRLEGQGPRRVRALVDALAWLGEPARGVRAARQAVEKEGPVHLETLRYALLVAGEFAQAEAIARRQVAAEPGELAARYPVDSALAAQGRVKEALLWLDQTVQQTPTEDAESVRYRQAMLAAATWDAGIVWPYAARALAVRPREAARLAVLFALLGDQPHAEQLAQALSTGSPAQLQYRALEAWRAGDRAGAMAALQRAEARDPWPNDGLAPAYLLAELGAAAGDPGATLAAVERFLSLPADRVWRAWAYPRALYLRAQAHLKIGQREEGRRELDRVLATLAGADPSVALAERARRLRMGLSTSAARLPGHGWSLAGSTH